MFNGVILVSPDMVLLSNREAYDFDTGASPSASVSWQFTLAGLLQAVEGGSTSTVTGEWWSAGSTSNIGNSYDVRCKEILSGPVFTAQAAAVGTYIQISTTRVWTLTSTVPRAITATFQIVANSTTTPILAEAVLTFTAEAETNE